MSDVRACTGDFYLYLSSEDNKDVFTENQAHNFHCIIEEGVTLEGKWEVAVTDYYFYPDSNMRNLNLPRPLYLLANFVKSSYTPICNGPVLKRIYIDEENKFQGISLSKTIFIPEYHSVSVTSLSLLRLYIADNHFHPIQLPHGVLAVTLHFRPKE